MHKVFISFIVLVILISAGYWYAVQPSYDMRAGVKAPTVATSKPSLFDEGSVPDISLGQANTGNPNPNTQSNSSVSSINPNQTNTQTNTTNTKKYMLATLHTNKGDITIEFSKDTPNTVANFQKLSQSGFYSGVKFHRVIKGFMIQGGDPLTKDDANVDRWGTGGPGYTFKDEIGQNNKNDLGTISMANSGPDTNGSQFFINAANNNFLDTKHTVFGRVVKGMDVVQIIENVKTGVSDRPAEPVVIESVSLE